MVKAERERTAEKESDDPAPDRAADEREPIHPRTAPAEKEGTEQITVEIPKGRIGLQEEIAIEHATNKENGSSATETVCPLDRRVGREAEN